MSDVVKTWSEWLKSSRFLYHTPEQKEQTLRWLFQVRDRILKKANINNGDTVLDIGTGTGLLAFGAYEKLNGSGKIIFQDIAPDCIEECRKIAEECNILNSADFLVSEASNLDLKDNTVDVIVLRSVLVHILDKAKSIKEFYRVLKQGGRISIFEPVLSSNVRYYELINPEKYPNFERIKQAETKIMTDKNDALTNFDENSLVEEFKQAGFKNVSLEADRVQSTYIVQKDSVSSWFDTSPSPGNLTMRERFLLHLEKEEVDDFIEKLKGDFEGKEITISTLSAYISAEK